MARGPRGRAQRVHGVNGGDVCHSICYYGNVCRSIFVIDGDVDLPWSPFAYAAVTSFRDDAVGPGIQTVRVMPWKGVGPDIVWSDPAFAWYRLAIPARAGFVCPEDSRRKAVASATVHRPDRPIKRRCPVLSSTGNTPGDSPSTASGGRVYGLFSGYRRMASAGG